MTIWLTSDTHFGHANMIPYCGRPENFTDIELKNFKKIPAEDMLIHLGDICIGKDEMWHSKIQEIPCRKILVRGNHDEKSNSWYLSHGWDFVCETFTLKFHKKKIIFSHQPQQLGRNDFNIHGHFHNLLNRTQARKWVDESEKYQLNHKLEDLTMNHLNFSIEEANYKPLKLETFINIAIKQNESQS